MVIQVFNDFFYFLFYFKDGIFNIVQHGERSYLNDHLSQKNKLVSSRYEIIIKFVFSYSLFYFWAKTR